MNTKRDFVRAARRVAAISKPHCRERTALLFAAFFAEENPRFDTERFLFACGAAGASPETVRDLAKEVLRPAA